jgi:hypothetical protein
MSERWDVTWVMYPKAHTVADKGTDFMYPAPSTYYLLLMLGLVYVPALVCSVPSFVRLLSTPCASLCSLLPLEEPYSVVHVNGL